MWFSSDFHLFLRCRSAHAAASFPTKIFSVENGIWPSPNLKNQVLAGVSSYCPRVPQRRAHHPLFASVSLQLVGHPAHALPARRKRKKSFRAKLYSRLIGLFPGSLAPATVELIDHRSPLCALAQRAVSLSLRDSSKHRHSHLISPLIFSRNYPPLRDFCLIYGTFVIIASKHPPEDFYTPPLPHSVRAIWGNAACSHSTHSVVRSQHD